ncbi:metal-dependent transcriptional regulator [bacterium]|nr:MAG: metal-dependent transcriptional regulator [bacterium]
MEDYLKVIFKLQQTHGSANTKLIADTMNYSAASVTNMIKKLATMGLADYRSHRGVTLTESGEKVALEVIRHHRLLELYLSEVMGYSWDEVHAEAEKLEHHISEQFEDTISAMLGHPKFDPHGDPIPAKDGSIPHYESDLLSDARIGETYIIRRIEEQSPEFLRYVAELGLKPNTEILLAQKDPFNGPIRLEIKGLPLIIGFEVAKSLHVVRAD